MKYLNIRMLGIVCFVLVLFAKLSLVQSHENTDYEKLVHLVVDDVLTIVQASKPSKTQLTMAIKLYFGLETPPEKQLDKEDESIQV